MLPETESYKKSWQAAQKELRIKGQDCAFVYVHLEADTGNPFYVGIGVKGERPWNKSHRTNKHKNRASKHGMRVEIIAENLSWEAAKWWEVRWIKALRTSGYDLVNLTDGGEGALGYKHNQESINKMSNLMNIRISSFDYVHPLKNENVKQKHLQSTQSEEFKQKQRERIKTEGHIIDRPGARERQKIATNSDDFKQKQRKRLLEQNPMFDLETKIHHQNVVSSFQYKRKKISSAPRGKFHYSKQSEEAIEKQKEAGRRLNKSQTKEQRSELGKRGWIKRWKRFQYWGA